MASELMVGNWHAEGEGEHASNPGPDWRLEPVEANVGLNCYGSQEQIDFQYRLPYTLARLSDGMT